MKIVIDIVDDDYNRINSYPDGNTFYPITARLYKAVKDGTPLDKHDEEVIKETVESIWGKPPYTELLDKIRAEIEQYQSDFDEHGTEYDRTAWQAYNRCLKIIDKYKVESEVQE